jgi:muramoyltetrapeptide carboxypeptidase
MIQPPFLVPGDTIGICATARWMTTEQMQPAIAEIESWGLKVVVMDQVFEKQGQLAGSDAQRAEALMALLERKDIQAILIARGGYGTVRIVDSIPDEVILNSNKWLCGYSDITVLHNRWNQLGYSTIHSTMPISFESCTPRALSQLRGALMGNWETTEWEAEQQNWTSVEGPIVGGNLSVVYAQLGSSTQIKSEGSIVFLEDVDEMLYHVDRMLQALKRAGIMQGAKGILVGGLTQIKDNTIEHGFSIDNPWGKDVQQIFKEWADSLNLPIAFDFPAGHWEKNEALYFGRPVRIIASEKQGKNTMRMELI